MARTFITGLKSIGLLVSFLAIDWSEPRVREYEKRAVEGGKVG